MKNVLATLFGSRPARRAARPSGACRQRARLGVEPLEDRRLLSGVPAFSSLPGAKASLYLDLDGHHAFSDWYGTPAGGASYVGSFTNLLEANTVYVFARSLGNNPKSIADAASHEAGHAFGLEHQSSYNVRGVKTQEYNTGTALKAPIMGNSYSAARSTWWLGHPTNSSTAYQNDMALIARPANGFGYRADDRGNTFATATRLYPSGSSVSRAGVIEKTTDTDFFNFGTTGGVVSLSVNVAPVGANLDARLSLYNAAGGLLATADPGDRLGATITLALAPGRYYVAVLSHGAYGDVGQYTLTGTVPNAGSSSLGGVVRTVAAAADADRRQELFAVGADGGLWHKWQVSPNGPSPAPCAPSRRPSPPGSRPPACPRSRTRSSAPRSFQKEIRQGRGGYRGTFSGSNPLRGQKLA
jgi:hypothetical protein